jgi:hypothetical protein
MAAKITLSGAGNGDVMLVALESGRAIRIDMNIRTAADDPDDDTRDVASVLPEWPTRDSQRRLGQRQATDIVDQLLTRIAGGLGQPSNNVW